MEFEKDKKFQIRQQMLLHVALNLRKVDLK